MEDCDLDPQQKSCSSEPYVCSFVGGEYDECVMHADEEYNYDENVKHISWAGLRDLPCMQFCIMQHHGIEAPTLENSHDARTVLGLFDTAVMQQRHGVRLLDAFKLVDPLAARLHQCLLESKNSTQGDMIYRLRFHDDKAREPHPQRTMQQSRYDNVDSAIQIACQFLEHVRCSVERFRARCGSAVDAQYTQQHGDIMLFYVDYGSVIRDDEMEHVVYENEFLPLFTTTWTVDARCSFPWRLPLSVTAPLENGGVQGASASVSVPAPSDSECEETAVPLDNGGAEGASASVSVPAPSDSECEKTAVSLENGGVQRASASVLVPAPSDIECEETAVPLDNGGASEKWPFATPMVPHPTHDMEMHERKTKNSKLYVGCCVKFSRRIQGFYGKHFKNKKGVVINMLEYKHKYYVVIPIDESLYKCSEDVNNGRKWVVKDLNKLGLGLEHVVCPGSSLIMHA